MDKILSVSPSGILTFDFDGRIALANPGAERLLRLPAAGLVGRKLEEVESPLARSLNSLLHSCLHYRDQLREEDREDFQPALQVAISRTEHLNAFMKGFAEVIRLPVPRLQPIDLKVLLEEIQRLLQAQSQQRHITWTWEVQEPLSPIQMDQEQMEQVFVNILKNAMEAIGEEGRIGIRMGREGGKPYVIIEDTGRGIPPQFREHLFTPFFSTKENGQGLGLTLVQEVLARHGFGFALESHPPDPTRFSIYF